MGFYIAEPQRTRQERIFMKEWLRELKFHFAMNAGFCIVCGVILFLWPAMSTRIACMALGAILLVMGVIHLLNFLGTPSGMLMRQVELALTIVFAAVGIWILLKPDFVASLIPIIMGILLITHGVNDLRQAVYLMREKYDYCWLAFALSLLTLAAGAVLIWNPFGAISLAVKFIGAFLVYDGVSDLWIMSAAHRVGKAVRRAVEEEIID